MRVRVNQELIPKVLDIESDQCQGAITKPYHELPVLPIINRNEKYPGMDDIKKKEMSVKGQLERENNIVQNRLKFSYWKECKSNLNYNPI